MRLCAMILLVMHYEIDIFDLYEIDVESAAQMIEEMFVYYAHHVNNIEGKN